MQKISGLVVAFVLVGAAASSAACGTADFDPEFENATSAEDVDIATEAIGEAGCGTMACTTPNSCSTLEIGACGSFSNYRLSTLPYGSAACPSQSVVRDTTPPTNGGKILAVWRWRGATLTAANCASAKVEAAIYSKTNTTSVPVFRGKETYTGVWSGSVCTLTSANTKPFVNAAPGLQEVRVTASARLGAMQQPVDVGYWRIC
jgi:hypothetical protein